MRTQFWQGTITRSLTAALILLTAAVTATSAVAKDSNTSLERLSCPDAMKVDLRPNPGRDRNRVREIAPSAGALTSPELYSDARFAEVAYDLYTAFDAGQDPRVAFTQPDLRLVALIYGDPGPKTELRPRPKDS
jgi:hypothetical protein